jgi:hypothetical protein
MTFRILLTGARTWTDRQAIVRGFTAAFRQFSDGDEDTPSALVHGGAIGADTIGGDIWLAWGDVWGTDLYVPPEVYVAKDFSTPLERNKHMVKLGADVCIAFAQRWSSGTGHCARLARKANIPVLDFGVPTGYKEGV